MTFAFDASHDGTNFSTTRSFTWSVPLQGTAAVRSWTNIPVSVLDNMRKLRLAWVTNANGHEITVSNLVWSITP